MNTTTRRYPRSMGEAFKDAHYANPIEVGHRCVLTRMRLFVRRIFNR